MKFLFGKIYLISEIRESIHGDREVTEHFLFNINEKVRHAIILFVYYAITGYAKFCFHST